MVRKIFALSVVCLLLLAEIVSVQAANREMKWEYVLRRLQAMQGDWYDESGMMVLSINDTYINGCEIIAGYDFVGGNPGAGVFRIREGAGTRDLRIGWNTKNSPADYITLNSDQMLHKTQAYYYESVAGIHLGMPAVAVRQVLGEPTSSSERGWEYKDRGVSVSFDSGGVVGIRVYRTSGLRLDRSGLDCSASMEDFARAYSMERVPSWPSEDYNRIYPIGYGEFIYFGKNMEYIALTLFNT